MIAYLDLAGGLAGDIFIAACLDATAHLDNGLSAADLTARLKALPLGDWELVEERPVIHGLAGRRISFRTHGHSPHRTWADIRDDIIGPADLPQRAKSLALAAFEALARAEASVHNRPVDEVHFHEVGADDSILDLVGGALCLSMLGVERLTASPVPLARGLSECRHGPLPLPAPATVALLGGAKVYGADCETELVTPTGAAVLTWTDGYGDLPPMELAAVGMGLGSRPPRGAPTRLFLGTADSAAKTGGGHHLPVTVITTTIDDMSPELAGPLMDDLLDRGALDVVFSPAQMKKNRPGLRLEIICPPGAVQALADHVLEETSSLGLRLREERRLCLERRVGAVEVDGREVEGKWARRPSGRWDFKPEFEAVRKLAGQTGRPLGEIHRRAVAKALDAAGPSGERED